MKKIFIIGLCLLTVFLQLNVAAQQKAKTELASVTQSGETIRFTLESSRPFIFGNNRYVLYIGTKEFYGKDQYQQDGKGYISFLVPASDYKQMKEGESIYLSYGQANIQNDNMEQRAQGPRCWSLGKFSSSLLK